MVTLAVVKTTLAEHKNIIKKLRDLPTKFHRMPLPSAIVEWITEMRNTRRWKWTTTLKQLALCQGALGLLPTYIHAEPIRLQTCPVWRQAVRGAAMMAKQEVPAQPLAITKRQMEETLDREKDPAIFSALLLSWATAARVGCVLKLVTQDVKLEPDRSLMITYRKGKGARVRGLYSVATPPVNQVYFERLQQFTTNQRGLNLFPPRLKGEDIKHALRRTDPRLEQRSIRRGAIQQLSKAPGMTDELLMKYSGHTRQQTLYRYMNHGQKADHTTRAMIEAAQDIMWE